MRQTAKDCPYYNGRRNLSRIRWARWAGNGRPLQAPKVVLRIGINPRFSYQFLVWTH